MSLQFGENIKQVCFQQSTELGADYVLQFRGGFCELEGLNGMNSLRGGHPRAPQGLAQPLSEATDGLAMEAWVHLNLAETQLRKMELQTPHYSRFHLHSPELPYWIGTLCEKLDGFREGEVKIEMKALRFRKFECVTNQ